METRDCSLGQPTENKIITFYFIKSETSDLFVNHFGGHFAYLKTLDFYFNVNDAKTTDLNKASRFFGR